MMKSLLLTPVACPGPGRCHHVARMFPMLGLDAHSDTQQLQANIRRSVNKNKRVQPKNSFQRAWATHFCKMRLLAAEACELEQKARKVLVLQDTTLFKTWVPQMPACQQHTLCHEFRHVVTDLLRIRFIPDNAIHNVFSCLCAISIMRTSFIETHDCTEECPRLSSGHHPEQADLAQFVASISCNFALNLDFAAEAKNLPKKNAQIVLDEDSDADREDKKNLHPDDFQMQVEPVGDGDDDVENDLGDLVGDASCKFPFNSSAEVLDFVLRKDEYNASLTTRKCTNVQMVLKRFVAAYGVQIFDSKDLDVRMPQNSHAQHVGRQLGRHFTVAVEQQKEYIKHFLAQRLCPEEQVTDDDAGYVQACSHEEVRIVPAPLRFLGPGAAAWQLCTEAGLNEEQKDAVALIATQYQKMWNERPVESDWLPSSWLKENTTVLFLGGGGCGKSYVLLKVIKPLTEMFFGPSSFEGQCPSNAGARLIKGRTVHATLGLSPASSLQVQNLQLRGKTKTKVERIAGPAAATVIDECSQLSATLFHADALLHTYARAVRHDLQIEHYTDADQLFGKMPVLILSGDFLQLLPVPESGSFLAPLDHASWEHRQGRAIFQKIKYVFEFKTSNRFKDPLLKEILEVMRTKNGCKLSCAAWKALQQTQVKSPDNLADTGSWFETSYDWITVAMAQHYRTRLEAAEKKKVLFLIVAVDATDCDCPKEIHRSIQKVPSMTATKKLMNVLPIFTGSRVRLTKTVMAPELVAEREGLVIGVELHPTDQIRFSQTNVFQQGAFLPTFLPRAIYVKFDDFDLDLIAPIPCQTHQLLGPDKTCCECQWFSGIVAVPPVAATWKFNQKVTKDLPHVKLNVERMQFPLAPALPKTIHTLQGTTCDPGLICHLALPKNLSPESKWLAYYVMLSRVRTLKSLRCIGEIDKSILEGGPPKRMQDVIDQLFEQRKHDTIKACVAARKFLCWPPRLQT